MKYSVLDQKRKKLLPLFQIFKKDFYLAGGTSLALQLEPLEFMPSKKVNLEKIKKIIIKEVKNIYKNIYK